MQLKEFLTFNGVTLMRNSYISGENPKETQSLGLFDFATGLNKIVGRRVWVCDYRNGDDFFGKPIRAVEPTLVEICDADKAKRNIYYSPIYFRAVKKDGTLKAAEIGAVDNTGFRSKPGVSINIFESEEECQEYYKLQLENALRQRRVLLWEHEENIRDLEQKIKNMEEKQHA